MFRIFFIMALLLTALSGYAQPFNISQLPFSLDGDWRTCTLESENSAPDCQVTQVPNNIESSFPDYDGLFFYQGHFVIDKQFQHQPLALSISTLRDSDEVYINGHLIGATGKIGPDFEKATLYSRTYFIPNSILEFEQTNSILIKVFNHARYGGLVESAPIIESAQSASSKQRFNDSLVLIFIGLLVLIAILQVFYFVSQPRHKEYLYFAILCIAEALYLWGYSQQALFSGIHLNTIFRANIFLYAFLVINFAYFITEFFSYQRPRWLKAFLAIVAISGIYSLFMPLDSIYHQVSFLNLFNLLIIIPFYFYLFYRSIKTNTPYAKPLTIVISLYIGTVLLDIAIDLQWIPVLASGIAGLISPVSLLLLFISIMMILIHKHWLYYRHATYDYLTETLRRSAFIERLSEDLQRLERSKQSMLVALIDIDDFKPFNDNFNHSTGDKVLKEVVERVRQTLREFDLIGRYGGDEFCIAAEVKDQSDGSSLLRRVHLAVTEQAFDLGNDRNHPLSITIGAVVTDGKEDLNAIELIEQADKILVQGKIKQKGKVHI